MSSKFESFLSVGKTYLRKKSFTLKRKVALLPQNSMFFLCIFAYKIAINMEIFVDIDMIN